MKRFSECVIACNDDTLLDLFGAKLSNAFPVEAGVEATSIKGPRVFVGKQLWSLPYPSDALRAQAVAMSADVLIFRDMKDRDPLRSVRCEAAIWIGEEVITFSDLIPYLDHQSSPLLLTSTGASTIAVTDHGLVLGPTPIFLSPIKAREGITLAAQIISCRSSRGQIK